MSLKEGLETLKGQVNEQLEFIEWLKSKGMYNPLESAPTMQKMHMVWEAMHEESYSFGVLWESVSAWFKRGWDKITGIQFRK